MKWIVEKDFTAEIAEGAEEGLRKIISVMV